MGFGLAASAGLNAFIPLLVVALADRISDSFNLGRPYDFLSSSTGIIIILSLLTIEIVVDKIPKADHINDLVQSAIRPASGAVLFMAVVNKGDELHPLVAMFFGLVVAGAVHWYKTTARPAITIQTNGVGNPFVSMVEDAISTVIAVLSVIVPLIGFISALVGLYLLRATYRWALGGIFSKKSPT
jgi:hypothetical protein